MAVKVHGNAGTVPLGPPTVVGYRTNYKRGSSGRRLDDDFVASAVAGRGATRAETDAARLEGTEDPHHFLEGKMELPLASRVQLNCIESK